MKICFGYARVSTAKQGEGVSIDAQKEEILSYAERNDITISQWFEEKETAAKQGRPIFNAMIKELRKNRNVGLVIHKIDRSARNFKDWAVIGDLNDAGTDIHFATETLDFRSRGGRLSADIQAVIAADYIRNLREETIKGIRGRLKQGLYPFKAPLGYLDNGGGKPKTPDPLRARFLKEMFRLYATGNYSIRKLQAEFSRQGLTNNVGKSPSKRLIETILSNSFYCGVIRINTTGETYTGIHEPLITTEQFYRVQEVKSGKCGKKVTKHNHRYRGLFRCALCKKSMIAEWQKTHVYYRCQTKNCPTKTVREDRVEEHTISILRSVRLSGDAINRLVVRVNEYVTNTLNQDMVLLRLQEEKSVVEAKLEMLTDALLERVIDNETYGRRREQLLLQKRNCEERADEKRKMISAPETVRHFLEFVKNLAGLYQNAIGTEKREIMEYATSNRFVNGKKIEFTLVNWLETAKCFGAVPYGDPTRPNSRRVSDNTSRHIKTLVTTAYSEEVRKFIRE